MDTQPTTQEQAQQSIADQIQSYLDETPFDDAPESIEAAHLSASIGIAENAQGRGWITYVEPQLGKIFISTGRIRSHKGTFTGGGGLPGGPRLPGRAFAPHLLAGKTGTFRAEGEFTSGAIRFFLDGRQVTTAIPLVGLGLPFDKWHAEGEVLFTKVD